jgi:hypothetical protein
VGFRAEIGPARQRIHDDDLGCDVLRTYGYRARCRCGWRGPLRDRHHEARLDGREHTRAEHGKR